MNLILKSIVGLCFLVGSSMAWGMHQPLTQNSFTVIFEHYRSLSNHVQNKKSNYTGPFIFFNMIGSVGLALFTLGKVVTSLPAKPSDGDSIKSIGTVAAVSSSLVIANLILYRLWQRFFINYLPSVMRARREKLAFEQSVIGGVRNIDNNNGWALYNNCLGAFQNVRSNHFTRAVLSETLLKSCGLVYPQVPLVAAQVAPVVPAPVAHALQ